MFTLFGQFFDHGLDLVGKSGTESVIVPLQPDDPLFVPGAPTDFMVASRTVLDPATLQARTPRRRRSTRTRPTPRILRIRCSCATTWPARASPLRPAACRRCHAGNIGNWGESRTRQRRCWHPTRRYRLLNVPLLLTDEYGRFLRGPNGFPQLALTGGGASRAIQQRPCQRPASSGPGTRSSTTSRTTPCRRNARLRRRPARPPLHHR